MSTDPAEAITSAETESQEGANDAVQMQQEQQKLEQLIGNSSSAANSGANDQNNVDSKDNDATTAMAHHAYRVPRLDEVCVSLIADQMNEHSVLDALPSEYVDGVVKEIDLSRLSIDTASQQIVCSKLWQRMSTERWNHCNLALHGNSWKRLYLEKHINELLESYYASSNTLSNINYQRLLQSVKSAAPFIYSTQLRQLPSHLDLSAILPLLPNLASLDVTYKTLNVGMNDCDVQNGMHLNDALNISKYLQSSKTLAELRLSECLIDDETMHILMGGFQQNTSVTSLQLPFNKISDIGVRRVAQCIAKQNRLQVLVLSDNQINDEGIQYIASALAKNTSLLHLDVSLNNIGDKGAIQLFDCIALNQSLQHVNVSCNHLTQESVAALIGCLKQNKTLRELNVSGNANLNQEDNLYAPLKRVLTTSNQTLIALNIQQTGLTALQVQTIQKVLKPRQIEQLQDNRKKVYQ